MNTLFFASDKYVSVVSTEGLRLAQRSSVFAPGVELTYSTPHDDTEVGCTIYLEYGDKEERDADYKLLREVLFNNFCSGVL